MLFPHSPNPTKPRRVVITGAGIVTALGLGWEINAQGFRSGQRAFAPVTLFDVSRHRVKSAAAVELPATLPQTRLGRRRAHRLERAAKLLLHAAIEAWDKAGSPAVGAAMPLVLGTTSGGMSLGERYYRQATSTPANHRGQATRVLNYQAQQQGLDIQEAMGVQGPINIIANACASGANAVGHAFELVRRGHADCAFAAGYDALSELVFTGFDVLQALSPTECRPFDADRDGLALGDGAAAFVIESLDRAERRGASILGELVGYGASTDTHHLTQPHPAGEAAFASMSAACASAGVTAEHIGYINAHGTGTPLNDSAEAAAINRWAGARAATLPVSSTKASVGHLMGAAGAVEVAVCLMALQGGWLPPTSNLRQPDAACRFPIVRRPQDADFDFAMTNSFGFGGANASILLRRWA